MMPPELSLPSVTAAPLPLTTRLPVAPVLLRIMPLAGPLAAVPAVMLLNSRLLAPIVVALTLRAVPVVVVSVFNFAPVAPALHGLSSQTLTVPPPVAVKAGLGSEEHTSELQSRLHLV